MKPASMTFDKVAIALSLACAVHCLLLPIALSILPTLAATTFGDESFHQWMLFAVLPTSLFALAIGCRQHRNMNVLTISLLGLVTLIFATIFGHNLLGESGEKVISLLGTSFIAFGHYKNHMLCRHRCCDCAAD